jgi:cytochrome c-type biogenesis protein CcmH
MIWLAAIAVALMAASMWFLARPLARLGHGAAREEYHQLLTVRDRLLGALNELDIEAGDRTMDADAAADERLRLEAELAEVLKKLEALPAPQATEERAPRRAFWRATVAVLAVLVPAGAIGLYVVNATVPPARLGEMTAARPGVSSQVLDMIGRLEERLKAEPEDGKGWARLGRSYAVLGRLEEAKKAYAQAYRLLPEDPEVLAGYAGLLYSEAPRVTEGLVATLYARLHRLEPDNGDALWFLGLAAFQAGDARTAIRHWQRLLGQLPPDSPEAEHLKSVIAKAREKLPK